MNYKSLILIMLGVILLISCFTTTEVSTNDKEVNITTTESVSSISTSKSESGSITRPYIEPVKETQPPISFYYDENNNLIGVFVTENTTVSDTMQTSSITTTIPTTTTTTITTTTTELITTSAENSYIIAPNNFQAQPKKDIDYFNDCAFVGDSIIKSLSGYLLIDESSVIAKIGISPRKIIDSPFDTYYGYMTACEALQHTDAKNIYILLGSNSLDSCSSSEDNKILEYYGKFLDDLLQNLPDATLYVISVTPVTDHCKYDLNNERITNFNVKLYSLCTKKGIYYVDAFSDWFDDNGELTSDMYEPDGIHFRKKGCSKLLDILLENTAN